MCDKILEQYIKMSNQRDDCVWKTLENFGGGFNVNYEVLRDKEKRAKIAAELRKAADCLDETARILNKYLPDTAV